MIIIKLEREQIQLLLSHIPKCEEKKEQMNKIRKKLEKSLIPIKISSRKGKARNLQKWVCEKIASIFGIEYNQKDDQCLIHSREMGQAGVDIILRIPLLFQFPFSIECKSAETFNLRKSMKQAINNTRIDTFPLIIYKCKEFDSPFVIMFWNVFERIIRDGKKERY